MMAERQVDLGDLADGPDLSGRVILVVGATGAIGEAVALAAARAGAELIVAGRQMIKLERLADAIEAAAGTQPLLYPVDLAGAAASDYDQMAAAIAEQCGRLDAVVHLAADFPGLTPLDQIGSAAWQRTLKVNLEAPLLIDQSVQPLLRETGGRILITLEDMARMGRAYWGGYGVSKHALAALSSIAAQEVENLGIAVVGVIPPPTRSRLRAKAWLQEETAPADPARVAHGYLKLVDPGFEVGTGTAFRLVA